MQYKGRKVVDIEIEGIDAKDYPDFCDAFISSASFEDGVELTELQLDTLTDENYDYINQHCAEEVMSGD